MSSMLILNILRHLLNDFNQINLSLEILYMGCIAYYSLKTSIIRKDSH